MTASGHDDPLATRTGSPSAVAELEDLSTNEEATVGGGLFRVNRDDDLTATGSVLGTPAYMPPEQERGETFDQRADVFADPLNSNRTSPK